jgi:biotin carboxyl carrier protein
MPGKVLEVLVAAGDIVAHDTPLIRMEAMKMEQTIRATAPARVREVRVEAGAMVGPGAVLMVLDTLAVE